MPGLSYPCVCCHKRGAEDEYHWFLDCGTEIVWKLCEVCCEFACEMVELFSHIEQEMVAWQT